MICETCNNEHDGTYGTGRFCSSKCAKSFSTLKIKNKKKRIKCTSCGKVYDVGIQTTDSRFICNECRTIESTCLECGKLIKNTVKQKFCSRSCSSTYNNRSNRKTINEKSGDIKIYRTACKFLFNVYDYPEKFDLQLVEKYGWYKAKNRGDNPNGISRDHIISIKYGLMHNIPSYIISHPANCQLLPHTVNNKKKTKCELTLDDLIIKINNWSSS